jgi:hypothetical protein
MRFKTALIVLLFCSLSYAQKVELAVLGGGQISFNPNSDIGTGVVLQGNAGFRVAKAPLLALYAEIPVTASFAVSRDLPSNVAARDYRTLFVTPGLRLKLAPISPVSPFFTLGFGWARYSPQNSTADPTTTNVVQFGGGTDFKIAPFLSIRTEVRDYFTGPPRLDSTFTRRQHNIAAMGGLVVRF